MQEPQEKVFSGKTLKHIWNVLFPKQTKFGGSQSQAVADAEVSVSRSSFWISKEAGKKTNKQNTKHGNVVDQ